MSRVFIVSCAIVVVFLGLGLLVLSPPTPTPYTLPPTAPQMERRFAPEPPPARDPRIHVDTP